MEKAFASCWGRSGDNFQSLENKNIPVPTKPQLSLRSYFPLVHWQHPRLPPTSIVISVYFRGTQLVYPERMASIAQQHRCPCGC